MERYYTISSYAPYIRRIQQTMINHYIFFHRIGCQRKKTLSMCLFEIVYLC